MAERDFGNGTILNKGKEGKHSALNLFPVAAFHTKKTPRSYTKLPSETNLFNVSELLDLSQVCYMREYVIPHAPQTLLLPS